MSLFRRFESAVCQPSNPPRQLAAPLARLQTPPAHVMSPHACTAALLARAGACHSLGVSKAPFASPQTLRATWQPMAKLQSTAAPLARLQTPPVHVMSPRACTAALPAKAGACHSLGVSKAPFASLQTLCGSWQQPCWRKPVHVTL